MRRTSTSILTAAMVVALAGGAAAQATTPDTHAKDAASSAMTANADQEFVNKAAHGSMHEVEGGKIAAAKATSAAVKAYANRLVVDHVRANRELMGLMKKKHISVMNAEKPQPEPWRSQTGAALDRAFIEHAVTDHQQDIALFEAEAANGRDADLKAWAAQTLPTLREHLKMAQDLQSKLPASNNQ